jgi:hypothetical protein
MVEVGRHLHRQLAAAGEGAGQPPEQRLVVGQPLQGGVGEHHVPAAAAELGDVAELEAQAVAGQGAGALEHRRGAVKAERVAGLKAPVELGGQLAAAAAEVDRPAAGHRPDQVEQVVEGLGALGGEARVLLGVPGVHPHTVRLNRPRRHPISPACTPDPGNGSRYGRGEAARHDRGKRGSGWPTSR